MAEADLAEEEFLAFVGRLWTSDAVEISANTKARYFMLILMEKTKLDRPAHLYFFETAASQNTVTPNGSDYPVLAFYVHANILSPAFSGVKVGNITL